MQSATERRQEVLYFISDRRRVTYQQIADEFGISHMTARRDVEIQSFALIGQLVDGVEIPDPEDAAHFAEHFAAYRVRDGTAAFDEEQYALQEQERVKEDYRQRRETECFSVINRGQLWYEGVTIPQLLELRSWYKAWLNVTETLVVPEKPAWLD